QKSELKSALNEISDQYHGFNSPIIPITPIFILEALSSEIEEQIVQLAGIRGAITIATMAGRGTDIKLSNFAKCVNGLRVIGTEKPLNQRLEGQLRGRSGRQGEPGSTQFYLSAEDDFFKRLNPKQQQKIKRKVPDTGMQVKDVSDLEKIILRVRHSFSQNLGKQQETQDAYYAMLGKFEALFYEIIDSFKQGNLLDKDKLFFLLKGHLSLEQCELLIQSLQVYQMQNSDFNQQLREHLVKYVLKQWMEFREDVETQKTNMYNLSTGWQKDEAGALRILGENAKELFEQILSDTSEFVFGSLVNPLMKQNEESNSKVAQRAAELNAEEQKTRENSSAQFDSSEIRQRLAKFFKGKELPHQPQESKPGFWLWVRSLLFMPKNEAQSKGKKALANFAYAALTFFIPTSLDFFKPGESQAEVINLPGIGNTFRVQQTTAHFAGNDANVTNTAYAAYDVFTAEIEEKLLELKQQNLKLSQDELKQLAFQQVLAKTLNMQKSDDYVQQLQRRFTDTRNQMQILETLTQKLNDLKPDAEVSLLSTEMSPIQKWCTQEINKLETELSKLEIPKQEQEKEQALAQQKGLNKQITEMNNLLAKVTQGELKVKLSAQDRQIIKQINAEKFKEFAINLKNG
ncbi:MAG: hypothetical protein DRP78_03795, partial [Candidatus Omnitrophota bacterium]